MLLHWNVCSQDIRICAIGPRTCLILGLFWINSLPPKLFLLFYASINVSNQFPPPPMRFLVWGQILLHPRMKERGGTKFLPWGGFKMYPPPPSLKNALWTQWGGGGAYNFSLPFLESTSHSSEPKPGSEIPKSAPATRPNSCEAFTEESCCGRFGATLPAFGINSKDLNFMVLIIHATALLPCFRGPFPRTPQNRWDTIICFLSKPADTLFCQRSMHLCLGHSHVKRVSSWFSHFRVVKTQVLFLTPILRALFSFSWIHNSLVVFVSSTWLSWGLAGIDRGSWPPPFCACVCVCVFGLVCVCIVLVSILVDYH